MRSMVNGYWVREFILTVKFASIALAVGVVGCVLTVAPSFAQESLSGALGRAYNNTPELNAQRANVRALDELVPQALSGYRPRITATADIGRSQQESITRSGSTAGVGVGGTGTGAGRRHSSDVFSPRGVGVQVDQTLFNGFRVENSTRAAESRILGARETLRNTEQTVLLNAATSYMNVLRDTALLNLQRNNVEVLEEQLRQTRDRFKVGEVTRTDVAQSESRLAASRSQASVAEGNLRASIATYRQRVGVEPKKLGPAQPIEKLLPKDIETAVRLSQSEHPAIIGSLHGVDAQQLQVKVVEGELYPSVTVTGALGRRYESAQSDSEAFSASVVARLSVPIYQGGQVSSRVREAKETLGERRIQVDQQRDVVRQAVVASWSGLISAKAQIIAAQAQVAAAEIALSGVREEAKVGQRTTIDVLNSQQELLTARVSLITAQRDRVVASYNVLASIGRLSAQSLSLKTATYNPKIHYDQVRDKWIGTSTPDGR
ncbi:MAG: TolC family outer membrane protein [Beijerinckiaceae bacterium]